MKPRKADGTDYSTAEKQTLSIPAPYLADLRSAPRNQLALQGKTPSKGSVTLICEQAGQQKPHAIQCSAKAKKDKRLISISACSVEPKARTARAVIPLVTRMPSAHVVGLRETP